MPLPFRQLVPVVEQSGGPGPQAGKAARPVGAGDVIRDPSRADRMIQEIARGVVVAAEE
jgi:hypothetical protein